MDSIAEQPSRRFQRGEFLFAGGLFAVALALRLPNLAHSSFWLDEVLQINCTRLSLAGLWECAPRNKPPLDYLAQWVFLRMGDGEWWARLHACLFGSALVVAFAAWGRVMGGRLLGAIAGLLAVANPMLIRFSQEGRPSTLLMLSLVLFLLALWSLWRSRAPLRWSGWGWLTAALALCIWSHYLALYGALAAGGFMALGAVAIRGVPQGRAIWTRLALVAGGGVLAAFPLFLRALAGVADEFSAPFQPDTWKMTGPYLDIYAMGYEWWNRAAGAVWVIAALTILGFAGWMAGGRRRAGAAMFCMALFLFGFFGPFVFYWKINHWMEMRYTLAGFPGALMLAAMGLHALGRIAAGVVKRFSAESATPRLKRMLPIAAACIVALSQIVYIFANPFLRTDWRDLGDRIAQERTEKSTVIMGAAFNRFPVYYYLEQHGLQDKIPVIVADNDPEVLTHALEEGGDVWLVIEGYAVPPEFRALADTLDPIDPPVYGIEVRRGYHVLSSAPR